MTFLAGMSGVPAITDMLSTSAVSSVRNNGQRRFFQPYLIDRYGDRGAYSVKTVAVRYSRYSDDGRNFIDGSENVTRTSTTPTLTTLDWYSDLVKSGRGGKVLATKTTSADGFHLTIDLWQTIFQATGTLTTTVGSRTYVQPANGT